MNKVLLYRPVVFSNPNLANAAQHMKGFTNNLLENVGVGILFVNALYISDAHPNLRKYILIPTYSIILDFDA